MIEQAAIGDTVRVVVNRYGFTPGDLCIVEKVETNSRGRLFAHIRIISESNNGATGAVFFDDLEHVRQSEAPVFTVTRKQLEMWQKVLLGQQELEEPDAEEVVQVIDDMLNPEVTQEYSLAVSGKSSDIEDVLSILAEHPKVQSDAVNYAVRFVKETKKDA